MLQYYGGKKYLAKSILPLIPDHKCYVEVFGGGGWLLYYKPKSKIEVYNDIDGNLVNLFRVIRDERKMAKLIRLLMLTPYSRAEYDYLRKKLSEGDYEDDVERAYVYFYVLNLTFNADLASGGLSVSKVRSQAERYLGSIEKIPLIHRRLMSVIIENLDFRKLIPKYDSKDTFMYLDPPYVKSTRVETERYIYEMEDKDHRDLVEILNNTKCKWCLSGYENEIYEKLKYEEKITIEVSCSASTSKNKPPRKEVLYLNYKQKQMSLFDKKLKLYG